jgi:hypothetical protein
LPRNSTPYRWGNLLDKYVFEFEVFDQITVAVGAPHLKLGLRDGLAAGQVNRSDSRGG